MRWICGFVLCLIPPVALAAEIDAAVVDGLVKDALKAWQVPGAAVAIVYKGEVVYLKGHGVREWGRSDPVTADTLFPIASCTKAFTTTAMAMLVDDGLMKWDDPVRKHLEYFHLSDPLIDASVTLRDIVSHRTGIHSHDLLWYKSPLSQEERIRRLAHLPIDSPFRASFHYQSTMFTAAGHAVATAAKKPWADTVRDTILKPLGMKDTVLTTTAALKVADHASPHRLKGRGEVEVQAWYAMEEPEPAGSLVGNVRDLAKWVRFQLSDGSVDGKRLVSARNLRETHTAQNILPLEGLPRENNPEATQMSYGMGWIIADYRGHATVGHGGAIDGFRAHLLLLPDDDLGIVLVNNLHQTTMNLALSGNLVDYLLGLSRRDWNRYFLDREKKRQEDSQARSRERFQTRHHGKRPSREPSAYTGRYQHPAYGDVEVSLDRGGLVWKFNSFRGHLEHFHYNTFVLDQSDMEQPLVTFTVNPDGEVKSMTVTGLLGVTFVKGSK